MGSCEKDTNTHLQGLPMTIFEIIWAMKKDGKGYNTLTKRISMSLVISLKWEEEAFFIMNKCGRNEGWQHFNSPTTKVITARGKDLAANPKIIKGRVARHRASKLHCPGHFLITRRGRIPRTGQINASITQTLGSPWCKRKRTALSGFSAKDNHH